MPALLHTHKPSLTFLDRWTHFLKNKYHDTLYIPAPSWSEWSGSLPAKWSQQCYWWWRWGNYSCFYALQLKLTLQDISVLLDVFSSSRSYAHSFMHFKFSSDAILIFSNSSLMQFRYKADTFHAVFALEILAPCISVHIFHAHQTSVACISVHAHWVPVPCTFHAPQISVPCTFHVPQFQFHAFQYYEHRIPVPCISVHAHQIFQFHAFQCMHIEFQFHAFQCYAHWIPVPCISVLCASNSSSVHALQIPVPCTLCKCIFSMHVEFQTHAAHQISFLCMFHAF